MIDFAIDIETIPDQTPGVLQNFIDEVKAPGQYKKTESIQKWHDEIGPEIGALDYARTSLNGISGEICSIAWSLGDGEPQSLLRRPGESEKGLLRLFWVQLSKQANEMVDGWPRLRWIGFNIIAFNMRFLQQRCWITGVKPSFTIPVDARHGSDSVYDCMKAWAGWKGYVSQDAIAKALGLEGKGDITGADVWPVYEAGEYDKIEAYNRSDVKTVMEIYKRLTWKT